MAASMLQDAAEAEDVVQEAAIRARASACDLVAGANTSRSHRRTGRLGDAFKLAMSTESHHARATMYSFDFVALESDKPVDTVAIDDLPIRRAPWQLLQVVHD